MMTIPAILYPVLAAFLAIIVGRIGTIIMDHFRKDEILVDAAQLGATKTANQRGVSLKHG